MKRPDMCNSSSTEKKREEDERHIAKNFPKQIKYQTTNYSISPMKPSWLVTKRERKNHRKGKILKAVKGGNWTHTHYLQRSNKKSESQYLTGIMETTYNILKENK